MNGKRIFFMVLDSFGIGHAPDAQEFGDVGANTLRSIAASEKFHAPNMKKLGLFNIEGVDGLEREENPIGSFARMREASKGKDTTIGHWEIAGLVSPKAFPTYPDGFPDEVLEEFSRQTGRGILCNRPYSGTEVIRDYGEEHLKSGKLIVYTSADSVFQIAAHEELVPIEELYRHCETARRILQGKHGVGRVIARPFIGEPGSFTRTSNRHDFSLVPPRDTMLDVLRGGGYDTLAVGKIYDIFAGKGISWSVRTKNNDEGMEKTLALLDRDFCGICFVNLVDCDMIYGHRRDVDGYARSISDFDAWLSSFMPRMREGDILMISADHGCDPGYRGTDHTREYVPFLAYGEGIRQGADLKTRASFADIAATILDLFELENQTDGKSFKKEILQ